ncbi:30S ribosomal protein S27ae [archaeon]|jgi:ubiquitin-small subunit ribosomal protein S27Ae|nr:30S ribosomal protein S27ae [archaeon]MBT4373479.1 30S ribosomal protein S27ae [archaeon]MBT4531927.1 30S ribosomal protein S27ae [archaeon]MBT7001594.1 30S ribosomal protein S27ae [archaeon]MBT7282514.1 30S ribosomal protein S27ae [archaeon]
MAGKEGKKPHKNKPTSKKYSKYKIEGDKAIRTNFCPRCGPGIFLMVTNDRKYCGKCHYSEFEGKKPEVEKKEEKVE